MRLKDLTEIKINFETADFWVVRRGSIESVGSVTQTFNKENFGIKVIAVDILLPKFLYYSMMDLHSQGHFKPLAVGSLSLVHIRAKDIENIQIG